MSVRGRLTRGWVTQPVGIVTITPFPGGNPANLEIIGLGDSFHVEWRPVNRHMPNKRAGVGARSPIPTLAEVAVPIGQSSNLFRRKPVGLGIPAPVPTVGTVLPLNLAFVLNGLLRFASPPSIPDFGRFSCSRRLTGCAWPHGHARQNLPHRRSRDGYWFAQRVHTRTGWVLVVTIL